MVRILYQTAFSTITHEPSSSKFKVSSPSLYQTHASPCSSTKHILWPSNQRDYVHSPALCLPPEGLEEAVSVVTQMPPRQLPVHLLILLNFQKQLWHAARGWQQANPAMSILCLLTSFDALVTFGAVCGAEGAPSSGDGWNHTGIGRVAVDPAGLSVARFHWGAAVHWMGNPWGLRTGAGEQLGSLATSWA